MENAKYLEVVKYQAETLGFLSKMFDSKVICKYCGFSVEADLATCEEQENGSLRAVCDPCKETL